MKKLILIFAFFLVLPSWALCPIGEGESVCTLPNQNQGMTLFQNQNSQSFGMNEKNMPSNSLKSTDTNNSFNRTLNQSGIKMQGSLGCTFGNCNKENNNDFLMNQ